METSVFIAKMFGIFCLAAAAGMMINRQFYRKFMEDYANNTALIFFSGMFAIMVGTAIVLLHNVWAANWTVIITFIGWAALLKGAWLIVFPRSVAGVMQAYLKNDTLLTVHLIFAFIFGAVLTFFGFFAG